MCNCAYIACRCTIMIEIEIDWKSCVGILSSLKFWKSPIDNILKLLDNVEDYYVYKTMCVIDVCTMCIIHHIFSLEISESVLWKFKFFSNLKIKNGHSAKSTRKFKISIADSTSSWSIECKRNIFIVIKIAYFVRKTVNTI